MTVQRVNDPVGDAHEGRRTVNWSASFTGVRARVLAIALIPSIVFAAALAAAGIHLVDKYRQDQAWAEIIRRSAPHSLAFTEAILNERRLTMLLIAHVDVDRTELRIERSRVDAGGQGLAETGSSLVRSKPGAYDEKNSQFSGVLKGLTPLRTRVDTGSVSVDQAYQEYSRLTSVAVLTVDALAPNAPDVESAVALNNSAMLLRAADSMSAAYALLAAAGTGSALDRVALPAFVGRVGAYHAALDALTSNGDSTVRQKISELTSSAAWLQLTEFENSMVSHGSQTPEVMATNPGTSRGDLPASRNADSVTAQQSLQQFVDDLLKLWHINVLNLTQRTTDIASDATWNSVLGAAGISAIAALTFLITSWLANRLIQRLRRLQLHTLAVTNDQLPAIMARIRDGEQIDLNAELPPGVFGEDEIGQVAKAFDAAQRVAVSAAMTEAKTQGAVNAVFLNLAHRSQTMAHRQLEVLDAAEAREENPAQLEVLFQLDHLATRARRNAENLIILGGERPGRQWRSPVPLRDIVRSSISETQDYARVRVTRFPEVNVSSMVVADVIHLLAELIENATYFSPPNSRVEASCRVVGRGAVVEIIDQGLGMVAKDLSRVNDLLSSAPDFGVMQLSSDSRLGLIVVSILAGRNGIMVRLIESDYGGIKAIVLIPTALLEDHSNSQPPVNDLDPSNPSSGTMPGKSRAISAGTTGNFSPES